MIALTTDQIYKSLVEKTRDIYQVKLNVSYYHEERDGS